MDPTYVIILNGVGSVGKTSTALALQDIAPQPFLHVSMDVFAGMLPSRMFGHPDGMMFETVNASDAPSVIIRTGPVMRRAMRGMRRAIAAMAAEGNHLVVDEVMLGEGEAEDYRILLSSFEIRIVGLFAPLNVLEARERARGDREIGLARWQYDRVHCGVSYDLELDTSSSTPTHIAEQILQHCALRTGTP